MVERVVCTVECDADAHATHEQANQIEELAREYFKKGPTHGFDNGLGHLLDVDADAFIKSRRDKLAEIVGDE